MGKITDEKLLYNRILREQYRRIMLDDLSEYLKFMWDIVEPKREYVHNWHIDAMAEHLEAVTEHQIENLIISVPPRHMKSLMTCVFWPTWVWIKKPEKRFIFSSYSAGLSTRDAVKSRRIMNHERYRTNFRPKWQFLDDQNTKTRYSNDALGYRITTSVGGTGTGEGGDFIVVDDPIKATDSHSPTIRESVNEWWNEEMSNRANDPKQVGRVIIMQRLHENDLAGMCLKTGDYQELRLPAEYDEKKKITSIGWKDPRKEKHELLWPERFDREWITKEKRKLGSYAAAAQLQQDPVPKGGGLFKRKWWRYYKELPKQKTRVVQFWDCAQKPGLTNDYSVCATWMKTPIGYYLLDLYRNRVETPDLERISKALYLKWKPDAVMIEDKSAGSSLIQYLRRAEIRIPVIAYDPGRRDKETRAAAATPTIEAGNVFLPELASWLEDFILEHERFPNDDHDDQVDTTSMMVEHFNQLNNFEPRVRSV